jgi:hypothetical protein
LPDPLLFWGARHAERLFVRRPLIAELTHGANRPLVERRFVSVIREASDGAAR